MPVLSGDRTRAPDHEATGRTRDAMMDMKKIDIAALEATFHSEGES
jgi:hypothetical protein